MSDNKKAKQVVELISNYLQQEGDIEQLRSIVDEFDSLLQQEEKQNTAIITTAFTLDTQHKQRTEAILRDMFGSELEFEYVVNQQLLGGIMVKVYDRVLDLSIETALSNISQTLKQ